MSFLAQLQQKRKMLQPTETVVTTQSGKRYLELCNTTSAHTHAQTLETCARLAEYSYGFVVDTKPDTEAACILPNFLYLGSQDAVNEENIRHYRITHILSVGIETPNLADALTYLECLHLPCLDLPETQLFGKDGVAEKAYALIEAAQLNGGRVLVHCNAGVSRSASVCIAYLMQALGIGFDAAYALVKLQRKSVQPNSGFLRQLKSAGSSVEFRRS